MEKVEISNLCGLIWDFDFFYKYVYCVHSIWLLSKSLNLIGCQGNTKRNFLKNIVNHSCQKPLHQAYMWLLIKK